MGAEGEAGTGVKELNRDGCVGVGQRGVCRGGTTVGVEGWSIDRCGGVEEGCVWRGRTGHRGVWRCGTGRDVEVWSREGCEGC